MSVNINDVVTSIHSDYEKVSKLSELNTEQLNSFKNRVSTTIEKSKEVTLPIDVLNKLNVISFTLNGYVKTLNDINYSNSGYKPAFQYSPEISSKNYYTTYSDLIINCSKIEYGKVIGVDKTNQGLIDDLTYYDGKSNLSISKNPSINQDKYLHDIKIKDKYSVGFNFRLNRFPVKTWGTKKILKQYTTRRSDLISFNYENQKGKVNNNISFGAMAPYGVDFSDKIPPIKPNQHPQEYYLKAKYQNKFSPFSIAASVTYDKNKKLSVYTDYKFELGKFYDVRLDIEYLNSSKEFVRGFKEAIDNGLLNAQAFSFNGMSFSNFNDAQTYMDQQYELLSQPINEFQYAVTKSREQFEYSDRNYNTIQEARTALDNFKNYSDDYSSKFEYAINTAIETFSINGATFNTIDDAQNYIKDYTTRFQYAIDTASENFTFAGHTYNTIDDAQIAKSNKELILNQLMSDWDDYMLNYDVDSISGTFTENDMPIFTSTTILGTTSNTLKYNSKKSVQDAISSKSNQISKFQKAITDQISLVESQTYINRPIIFDGVTYEKDEETSAKEVATMELDRINTYYNYEINKRKNELENSSAYYSNIVFYDNETYNINSAKNALSNYYTFSENYYNNFNNAILAKEDHVNQGDYTNMTFTYDGVLYDNSDQKSIDTKIQSLEDTRDELIKPINNELESKRKDFSKKIKSNSILVSYSGETYGNNDAVTAYKGFTQLLSGYKNFGKTTLYKFTLYVNGKKEKISGTLNKVWGKKAKFLSKYGAIAKRPGFNPIGTKEVLYHLIEEKYEKNNTRPSKEKLKDIISEINSNRISTDISYSHIINNLNFSKLVSINTVPYKVNLEPNYINTKIFIDKLNLKQTEVKIDSITIKNFIKEIKKKNKKSRRLDKIKYSKLYNRYLYKCNNSVDFGDINIYYTEKKPNLSIIALDQQKRYGEEFTFTGNEFRVKGLLLGDSVDSVTLTSLGSLQDANITYVPSDTQAIVKGINKNGYLIRPSNAQGTGLDKYEIHYNIGIFRVIP